MSSPGPTSSIQAAPVPEATTTGQALIPSLNKETWEYLELRLWNSFSRKLWVLLTSILTVAGLLGLLGMNSWVKHQVDQVFDAQRSAFDAAKERYQQSSNQQLLASALLFTLEDRLFLDELRYERRLQAVRGHLTEEQWRLIQSKQAVAELFAAPTLSEADLVQFRQQLTDVRKTFAARENELAREIEGLRLGAGHLRALRATTDVLRKRVFLEVTADIPSLTAYYERNIYPDYLKELKKHTGSSLFVSSDVGAINSLWPDARSELRFYIPSAFDQLDK